MPFHAQAIDSLRKLPRLRRLAFRANIGGDPESTVNPFWTEYARFRGLRELGFIFARLRDRHMTQLFEHPPNSPQFGRWQDLAIRTSRQPEEPLCEI